MPTLITQKRHTISLDALAWSPDGSMIVSGGYSDPKRKQPAPVLVWDAATGERRASHRRLLQGAEHLAWSPDGVHIAAAGCDGTIHVWNWHTNETCFEHVYPRRIRPNAYVTWSPDGRWLATAGWCTEITIWDAATWQAHHTYATHGKSGSSFFVWSPDGTRVASRGVTTHIWDSMTGQTLWTSPTITGELAWSPDSRYLALARSRGAEIRDARTFQVMRTLESTAVGYSPSLAWSPAGQYLVMSGHCGNFLQLWDATTVQHIMNWPVFWSPGMQWSPDGRRLVCGAGRSIAQVWQVSK